MPENMWQRLCQDSGATAAEGFCFQQFRDFWLPGPNRRGNTAGLAQLHTGLYALSLDSVARRADWPAEYWHDLLHRPGVRVELGGLTTDAYNGRCGTVLGLQRQKGRYVVQLDPLPPPHDTDVKHLALKPLNLAPSAAPRAGGFWGVLRPAAPPSGFEHVEDCLGQLVEISGLQSAPQHNGRVRLRLLHPVSQTSAHTILHTVRE
jgi:hypothetical protein